MSGSVQKMVWDEDLKMLFFDLYSESIMELQKQQAALNSESEEENT